MATKITETTCNTNVMDLDNPAAVGQARAKIANISATRITESNHHALIVRIS